MFANRAQLIIKRKHIKMVNSCNLVNPLLVIHSLLLNLIQGAGISLSYMIVLVQFYLNQDLIDKYRRTFTVALSKSASDQYSFMPPPS